MAPSRVGARSASEGGSGAEKQAGTTPEPKTGSKAGTGADSGSEPARKVKDEKPEKQASTLRFHLETESKGMGTGKAKIVRSNPVTINVDRTPFVDEGYIEEARVVDGLGGHMIYVKFNSQGALRMQMATVTRPGRRVAILSTWTETRWLGAPLPERPIEDGVIAFTPDASREESERIVRGLNNVAIKLGNQKKPEKNPEKAKKKAEKAKKKAESEEDMFLK